MAEAGSGDAGGYTAFISYSHKDAAIGRWLHRKLEGYRLPKRLAGTEGTDGEVPARLIPIFRDRDELPAAGDLSEKVRAALAASRNLIIVCSPNSAASPWVAREITTFRELHPGRPIFTAIVDGEPDQCFSPALLEGGVEPLAADLRKAGDGRRLGLLKLVAGLAGVGLDALVQRDAARRIRRVTWITAAAVAATLVMAIMTTVALTSRREAQLQRSQAEGLVEFMLTDLRDKLREVGRLDVHATVNQRAIAYYAAQGDLENLSDDSLERRARILQAMGEDDEKTRGPAAALPRFREAHAVTSEIVARHPEDPQAIYAHAQSEYWLGYMAYLVEDWSQAEARWRGYKALADRLLRVDPTNPTSLREQGYATGNLCTLAVDRKESPVKALRACSAAVRTMETIVSRNPTERKPIQDLGNRYAWLGGAWAAAGRPDKALAEFQKQERLLEPLVRRDPSDANLQDQWMRALMATAEHLHRMGRRTEAVGYNERARVVAEKLTAHDPSNARWRKWIERIDSFPDSVAGEKADG
jgi:tetratricopeptide (TPR) repeat protein